MKKKIIVVDDDKGILTLLKFVLAKDYDLTMANNGATALQLLNESSHQPDLIISDLHMPFINGQSFINQLKISGFFRHIPILVLSAEENLDEEIKKIPFKLEGHIKKPFKPDELKKAISGILP